MGSRQSKSRICVVELGNEKKWARKTKNESCQKRSGEGHEKSETSSRTSYNTSEHKLGDTSSPSAFQMAVKVLQSASIELKSLLTFHGKSIF